MSGFYNEYGEEAGGSSITILYNGVVVDVAPSSIDFTGAGVTVTDDGFGNITVDIPGGGSASFVNNEIVAGSGTTWTLGAVPVPNTQCIYINGARQTPGLEYTIVGDTITTFDSWVAGTMTADYQT